MKRLNFPRHDERGAVAVEFALVFPILAMLIFGIISFGFLFAQDSALGNAARQVARYSVVEKRTCLANMPITDPRYCGAGQDGLTVDLTCRDVKAEVAETLKPLVPAASTTLEMKRGPTDGASSTKIPVCGTGQDATKPCDDSALGDNIYVTLKYNAPVMVPMIPGMSDHMDLSGEGVFRCEWS